MELDLSVKDAGWMVLDCYKAVGGQVLEESTERCAAENVLE